MAYDLIIYKLFCSMKSKQLEHREIQNGQHSKEIIIITEQLVSPSNYGMMLRTAEAFGVKEVIFISSEYEELTSKMKKTSRSTEKYINFKFKNDILCIIEGFKKEGFQILALERTNDSLSVNDYTFGDKVVLVTGSENNGISVPVLNQCDQCVEVPMYGNNSSMNVVIATGITLNGIIKS